MRCPCGAWPWMPYLAPTCVCGGARVICTGCMTTPRACNPSGIAQWRMMSARSSSVLWGCPCCLGQQCGCWRRPTQVFIATGRCGSLWPVSQLTPWSMAASSCGHGATAPIGRIGIPGRPACGRCVLTCRTVWSLRTFGHGSSLGGWTSERLSPTWRQRASGATSTTLQRPTAISSSWTRQSQRVIHSWRWMEACSGRAQLPVNLAGLV